MLVGLHGFDICNLRRSGVCIGRRGFMSVRTLLCWRLHRALGL